MSSNDRQQLNGSSSSSASSSSSNLNGSTMHSCEICGESGLTDERMLEHTQRCHVEGEGQCPFCGLTGASSAELLLHVNQAHLDYLTPENELMSFIDDSKTPSEDSMSCGLLSPSIAEVPTGIDYMSNNLSNGTISKSQEQQQNENKTAVKCKVTSSFTSTNTKILVNNCSSNNIPKCEPDVCNGNLMDDNNNSANNNNNCDMANGSAGSGNGSNEAESRNHGEGSPLRSQLGLKLKANKPKITIPAMTSPLMSCFLCSYTTSDASILESHINRSHFDPISPGVNSSMAGGGAVGTSNHVETFDTFSCPICVRCFETGNDLELHVNHEHSDILSPAKVDSVAGATAVITTTEDEASCNHCPVCGISFSKMKTQDMEMHIEAHFTKSPTLTVAVSPDLEKEARRAQEQREFEMLRQQYGMDDQGNFREQSAVNMQRAVYRGEMSVADYYCRQVGLRAAESNGVDDSSSCTKSVAPRVSNLSASSIGVLKSYVCSNVDHYAASYGDRGWGCGYRNAQMMISSLYQNPLYNELLRASIGSNSMPSISKLQKMIESAWSQGFDEQGKEQLGCKLFETRKWIGATEIVTLFSWMRIECQLVDFHRPTALNGCHPELFNYVMRYFEQPRPHTPPLYLQHQGHSRTIIGIEQKAGGLTLLILDPSHSPKQVASLGSSQDSLRLIRRGPSAMKAPQYQIVSVVGKIVTEEDYQTSKVIHSLRIPPDH